MFFRSRLFFFSPFVSLHCSRPKSLIFFCFFFLSLSCSAIRHRVRPTVHWNCLLLHGPLFISRPRRDTHATRFFELHWQYSPSSRYGSFPSPQLCLVHMERTTRSLSFLELSSSPSPSLHKSIRIDYYPGLHTPGDLARLPSGRFKLGLAPVVVVSELLALFPFLFISYRLGHIKRRENSQQQIPTFT